MAASDIIAAAVAALLMSHPPMGQTRDMARDPHCGSALPSAHVSSVASDVAPIFRRPTVTFGCEAPVSGVALALDILRDWVSRADATAVLASLAPQPRVAVWIVPLSDPVDHDPISRAARGVIAAMHTRNPAIEIDRQQLLCLQRALYFEARGEGELGQAAVAHVALNRVGTRPGRATVCDVVREPGQFAPYLTGEPSTTDLVQTDEDATRSAIETAAQVMAGRIPDPSRGGQYFYAPRVLKAQPVWAKGMKETARIGGHRFFAEHEALATRLARD